MSETFAQILSQGQPDPDRGWLLDSKSVAEGFEISEHQLRNLKSKHQSELQEGTHWVSLEGKTCWTQAGIVTLASKLATERATQFAQAAQTWTVSTTEPEAEQPPATPLQQLNSILPNGLIDDLAFEVLEQHLPQLLHDTLRRILRNPTPEDRLRLRQIMLAMADEFYPVVVEAAWQASPHASLYGSATKLVVLPGREAQ